MSSHRTSWVVAGAIRGRVGEEDQAADEIGVM